MHTSGTKEVYGAFLVNLSFSIEFTFIGSDFYVMTITDDFISLRVNISFAIETTHVRLNNVYSFQVTMSWLLWPPQLFE